MENRKLQFLRGIGLNGSADALYMDLLPSIRSEETMYKAVEWLSLHLGELAKAGIFVSQSGLINPYYLGNYDLKINIEDKIDWFDLDMMVQIGDWNIPFIRFRRLILKSTKRV